jgi:hypothetical protein
MDTPIENCGHSSCYVYFAMKPTFFNHNFTSECPNHTIEILVCKKSFKFCSSIKIMQKNA